MSDRLISVTIDRPGERLDKALSEVLPDISRAQSQQLIKAGHVTIDGKPAKGSLRLSAKEIVKIFLPEVIESDIEPEDISLDIRYEDQDILVVNKPAGMVVHPAAGHSSGTLVNAILAYCPDLPGVGGERRPGIVHRLDKNTSGLIIVAKHDAALRFMQSQFKERSVKKKYLALVDGQFRNQEVIIDAPIGRHPVNRKKMAVIPPGTSAKSRSARTIVSSLEVYQHFSFVECKPITGRTHQIRVHLAYAKNPIVGDTVYGRRKPTIEIQRLFLHAAGLEVKRPADKAVISLWADLPEDLDSIMRNLA